MNKVIGGAILALIGLFAISKTRKPQPDIFEDGPKGGDITDKPLPDGGTPVSLNPSTNSNINCLVPPCPQIPGGSTKTAPVVTANAPASASINTAFESRKQSLVKAIERAGLNRDSFEKLSSKIMSMNKDEVGVLEAFLRNAATRTPMDYDKGKKFKEVNAKYALFPPAMVAALISGAVLK